MPAPSATILFVDDDPLQRRSMGYVLRQAGFEVVEAGSGNEALRQARERPDLVLLDVNLPDVNGLEVCRRLRADEATRSIPVLQVSAVYVQSEDRSQALENGADAYLVKPVEPRELVATVRTLLRVHAAEEAARLASRQWRTTFDALADAVFLLDDAGGVVRCNRAARDLLGRPFADILGQPYGRVVQEALGLPGPPPPPAPGEAGRQTAEALLGRRWFRVTSDPIVGAAGRRTGNVQVLTDVTRGKELEGQLRQAQKLEAVGRLAGGVAHDFNNMLTAILGNASLLRQRLPADDPDQELAVAIERAGQRAADLTRQLLGFARQTILWLKPTILNNSVLEVVAILGRTIDPRIVIETRLAPDLWLVQADPGQMTQVLMNLCINARDAMPEGGRLTLETANRVLSEDDARDRLEARPGEFVCLSVEDTGHGIPADVLPRIFEPFYTTKPPGQGTGLGLALVFGIVKQHNGWVECSSQPGRGTRFEVYLPRRAQTAADPPTPAPAPPNRGQERVLVVDDNEMLRRLAATFLRRSGFEVLLAEDGPEALEVFGRERDKIDLILLDLTMPRLSGRETLRRLREIDPGVPVVLVSGFADTAQTSLAEEGAQGFVAKPYREHDLLHAVRAALDKRPAPPPPPS
jgi:signal transduction histidine kinase